MGRNAKTRALRARDPRQQERRALAEDRRNAEALQSLYDIASVLVFIEPPPLIDSPEARINLLASVCDRNGIAYTVYQDPAQPLPQIRPARRVTVVIDNSLAGGK